jgi:uncharacterized membrane protein YhaH (DUF805 family)
MQELNPFEWALRPLKNYAVFSGRAPRAEYWWYVLAVSIIGAVVGIIDVRLTGPVYGQQGPLVLILTLALLIPGLAVTVRRLHDTDRSGWWALVRVPGYTFTFGGGTVAGLTGTFKQLPVSGLVAALVLFFGWVIIAVIVFIFELTQGTQGTNRYGPDPYGPNELEEVFA